MAGESAESFNYNRLYKACYDGHLGVVQQVLDCTAPERLTALINQHNVNHLGFTPLHQAARQGHIAIVSYLIERGADCNARSGSGQTILHVACIAGHTTTAELLLTHGADIEEKYKDSETALYLACFSGRNATAEMLIASGADVRVKDKHGYTALHVATPKGMGVIQLLIDRGGDINAVAEVPAFACLQGLQAGPTPILVLQPPDSRHRTEPHQPQRLLVLSAAASAWRLSSLQGPTYTLGFLNMRRRSGQGQSHSGWTSRNWKSLRLPD
eukprot:m.38903 g.38903  ORF g.38903 m.38903 type:complete len:270 (-) comp12621_c0_seq21:168-977(-)